MTIRVFQGELPGKIDGGCFPDGNGFTVVINSTKDEDTQAAAFLHECLHIWNEDHTGGRTPDEIETFTHEQLDRILKIIQRKDEAYR